MAASGARDGTAALYTLRDGRTVRVIAEPAGKEVDQVMLTETGYVVIAAAAGSALHLFTLNGLRVWSASLHAGASALCLSPCHTALLCGFDDGALCAWSLHDRELLAEYEPCPAPVVCMALTDACLVVGTSRSDIVKYPAPPLADVHYPGIQTCPMRR